MNPPQFSTPRTARNEFSSAEEIARTCKMHEMALAERVFQLVEETAYREQAGRVKTVVLEIGCLASVVPEALEFCFAAAARGTLVEGALLEIIYVPGAAWCATCCQLVELQEIYGACPECGAYPLEVRRGTEMRVKEIEIN